jgi:hypothetical protein
MRNVRRFLGAWIIVLIMGYGTATNAEEAPDAEFAGEQQGEDEALPFGGSQGGVEDNTSDARDDEDQGADETAAPDATGVHTGALPEASTDTTRKNAAVLPSPVKVPVSVEAPPSTDAEIPEGTARPAAASPVDDKSDASDDGADILTGTWTRHIVLTSRGGAFRFQPRGWVQPRFHLAVNGDEDYNDDEPFEGTAFSLQRARFGFQAWLFEWARVYLDTGWNSGGGKLVDFFVDLGPENGSGVVAVRLGFFRPYFIRQLLHATTELAMIEYARAWTDPALGLGLGPGGRQLGVGLQGFVAGGFEYGIGLWNGADSFADDPGTDFMGGGRIAVHPLGFAGAGRAVMPGNESDPEISDAPGLAIGAALYFEDRDDSEWTLPPIAAYEDRQLKLGVDLAFQYRGLSLEGEMFFTKAWAEDPGVRDMLFLAHLDAPGISAYCQAGYMVTRRVELVGRFDMVDENTEIRGIRFYPTVGATVFIFGNNLKVQAQYRINIGAGYEVDDVPGDPYIPLTHDLFFMVQASI